MGLSFSFTEEQELMRKVVREFAEKEIRPFVRYLDLHGDEETGQEKYMEIQGKAGRMGLLGMGIPEEYGGTKACAIDYGVVAEEIGRRGGTGLIGQTHGVTHLLAQFGSKEQKEKYIPKLVSGDIPPIGIGSTEPGCGSDISAIQTTAVRDGDEYVINGEKQFVSSPKWRHYFLVFCKTQQDLGARGISAILLEMNRPGVQKYGLQGLGWHHMELGGFVMKDVRVPVTNLVGEENQGFLMMQPLFTWMRGVVSCSCVGIAQGAIDESIAHVRTRRAFGKPIGKFQAVQFRIVEDLTILEAARWLSYRVLWLKDQGLDHRIEASMVKWWVPYISFNIVNNCIQNRGATGYTTDALDELRLRELRGYWIADGTIDIQKAIIGREILGKECDSLR